MALAGGDAVGTGVHMVRSTLSRDQVWPIFCLFAFATPLGILTGEQILQWRGAKTLLGIKGIIFGSAAVTFLFMATLRALQRPPMITACGNLVGFLDLLPGFLLTAAVRLLIGEAHRLG